MASALRAPLGRIRRRVMLRVFGNAVSLKANVLCSVYHRLGRWRYHAEPTRQAEASTFRRDGYLVLEPAIDSDVVESLRQRADELLARPELVVDHGAEGVIRLKGSLETFPELEAFMTDQLEEVVEAYFGCHFKIFSTDIYRTVPTPAPPDDSFLWHFDNAPSTLIKLMIYLDPTDRSTGAFSLKPKPVSLDLKRRGFWDRHRLGDLRGALDDPSTTTVFEGPAGTGILFNATQCIHRATRPEQGHRDVATFLLQPSTVPWREHLERARGQLSRNYGYCVNPFRDRPLRVADE